MDVNLKTCDSRVVNLQTRTLKAMTFLCGSYFISGENNGGINSAEFEASI